METKRPLETDTREQILQQQDNAIYKRRNAAIEQERIVKENDLTTAIRVAEQEHENQMLRQKNALEEVELESKLRKEQADAKAYANEVVLKALESVDKEVLLAILLSGMDSKTLITELGMKKLKKNFESIKESRDYGNGRFARKMLEEAEMNLAERICQMSEMEITKEMLTTINESDIPDVPLGERRQIKKIGFAC